jgi:hypothetical protein
MRTIFLRLGGASRNKIEEHLISLRATASIPDALYVDFCDDQTEEMVSLDIAISGRVDGKKEVFEFVKYFLSRFPGIAMDDYTDHEWSLSEITDEVKIQGHSFFDYQGWYEELKSRNS